MIAKNKLSIIIPARSERFMPQTVDGIFASARDDVEVIVVLDGCWPEQTPEGRDFPADNTKLKYIHFSPARGMRASINAAAALAQGEFLLKCDAHCLFEEGFDVKLKADMQDNWIVIPRRHSLDPINWKIEQNGKSGRDYHYLCWPDPTKGHDQGMHGVEWPNRSRERAGDSKYDIDDTMSFQGSCWFMMRSWFWDRIGGMKEYGYGTFSQEPQEIGNWTWLNGGEIKVNKKTWYAHLHKGQTYGRMYHQDKREVVCGHNYSAHYWMNYKDGIHDIGWLVDKFWPVPTWPDDWRSRSYAEGVYEYAVGANYGL